MKQKLHILFLVISIVLIILVWILPYFIVDPTILMWVSTSLFVALIVFLVLGLICYLRRSNQGISSEKKIRGMKQKEGFYQEFQSQDSLTLLVIIFFLISIVLTMITAILSIVEQFS